MIFQTPHTVLSIQSGGTEPDSDFFAFWTSGERSCHYRIEKGAGQARVAIELSISPPTPHHPSVIELVEDLLRELRKTP